MYSRTNTEHSAFYCRCLSVLSWPVNGKVFPVIHQFFDLPYAFGEVNHVMLRGNTYCRCDTSFSPDCLSCLIFSFFQILTACHKEELGTRCLTTCISYTLGLCVHSSGISTPNVSQILTSSPINSVITGFILGCSTHQIVCISSRTDCKEW